jgi:hypothetical protein
MGLGIGPAFAVFTLVVQNSVPVKQLGTATSSLTLFQQVGGTVGLAITGTVFATTLLDEVPGELEKAGVPPEFAAQFASGGGEALNQLSGVGDLGQQILANVPEAAQPLIEPILPAIVAGIHSAFSTATAATFTIGIVTALLAAVVVAVLLPGKGAAAPVTGESRPEAQPVPGF